MKDGIRQKIKNQIERYEMIPPGSLVLAAVSGGADSVCMLWNLKEYADEAGDVILEAVHVEHGIRGEESREDADFVARLCEELGIRCTTFHVDAPHYAAEQGQTLEEAARNLRYRAFLEAAARAADRRGIHPDRIRIATAHNACDQAETILFDMIRGSKSRGMAGIPPVRERIIRPMLTVTREEIEEDLRARKQSFCTDRTNLEDDCSRNRIRHRVLPELMEINSEALSHIGELAGHMLLVREDIDRRVDAFLQDHVRTDGRGFAEIDIDDLAGESDLLQSEIIHAVIVDRAQSAKDITSGHVKAVCGLLQTKTGKQVSLPYGLMAAREYGRLRIGKKETDAREKEGESSLPIDLSKDGNYRFLGYEISVSLCEEAVTKQLAEDPDAVPKIAYTKIFDCDKINSGAVFRTRETGDYLYLGTDGRRKKLKDYFIDEKMPVEDRDRTLLFACGSEVLWIVGHRMGGSAMITSQTKRCVAVTAKKQRQQSRENREEGSHE